VLVKINLTFAKYHDKRRFEVSFFVPEPKRIVYASNAALETIEKLKKYSCNVVIAPGWRNNLNNLLAVANEIYKYKADVLITSALLAEFEHYFIASLRPAPVIIGLLQGPPAQFVAPTLDWSISWSKHPLIDSPCDCSLFHLGLDLPDRDSIKHYSKDDLGIPGDCEVLMSAGRHVKFQNADFWNGILDILACFPNVYYIAVGVSREQVPFLDALLTPELSKRIILMGWREDFLAILSLANVLIDTFPSGGGHVLIEAMSLGIPFISFENDYMKNFDQSEWSVADEFVSIPELMVKRNNFLQFKRIAGKLIDDTEYRMEMGRLCKEQVNILMGSAEEKVRKYESVLLRVIEKKVVSKKWMNGTDDKDSNGHLSGQIKNLISRIKNYISIQSGSRRKS
jgi:glycosyltransferase involved in cell wall biosynthesis